MTKQITDYQQKQNYYVRKLVPLIRDVSSLWGNDSEQFLDDYIAEVLFTWKNDLQSAVICFEDLKAQALALGKKHERIRK